MQPAHQNTPADEPDVPDVPDDEPHRRPFAAFLREQRAGELHQELTDALAEVVQAVDHHGRSGTLTLTISISPSKVNGAVEVADKVASKLPEAERDVGLFFADGSGNLSRRDPRQPELPLREASTPTTAPAHGERSN